MRGPRNGRMFGARGLTFVLAVIGAVAAAGGFYLAFAMGAGGRNAEGLAGRVDQPYVQRTPQHVVRAVVYTARAGAVLRADGSLGAVTTSEWFVETDADGVPVLSVERFYDENGALTDIYVTDGRGQRTMIDAQTCSQSTSFGPPLNERYLPARVDLQSLEAAGWRRSHEPMRLEDLSLGDELRQLAETRGSSLPGVAFTQLLAWPPASEASRWTWQVDAANRSVARVMLIDPATGFIHASVSGAYFEDGSQEVSEVATVILAVTRADELDQANPGWREAIKDAEC